MKKQLELQFLGFWHVGTGKGGGPTADALVHRSPGGLPRVPGRTLKGLLRDAVSQGARLDWVESDRLSAWFGTALDAAAGDGDGDGDALRYLERRRYTTQPGALTVDDALLGAGAEQARRWEAWAARPENASAREQLYRELASTRIDADGIAGDRSLRAIEITVPVTLYAPIEGPEPALAAIARCLPLLRHLGAHRTRGLGRVQAALKELP